MRELTTIVSVLEERKEFRKKREEKKQKDACATTTAHTHMNKLIHSEYGQYVTKRQTHCI